MASSMEPNVALSSAEFIRMDYQTISSTERCCFVCGLKSKLETVPLTAREHAFLKRRLVIPKNNRCCAGHLNMNGFLESELMSLRAVSNFSLFDSDDFKKYMKMLTNENGASIRDQVGTLSLTEEQVRKFTGLKYEQLSTLASNLRSMRDIEGLSIVQVLIIFLFKMRTGASDEVIASAFGLSRHDLVSEIMNTVIEYFESDVLPTAFGFSSRSRDDLMKNETSPLVTELYEHDGLALVYDTSFSRLTRSVNNFNFRKSSKQSGTQLIDPFTICTTTGYVVDILIPPSGTQNLAQALDWVFASGLDKFLNQGDVFFVDRAFRDVTATLEEKGFTVLIPAILGGRKQLTTFEANEKGIIDNIRSAVDEVHGPIRHKYRIFDDLIDKDLLPKIGTLLKIACHLNNVFGGRHNADSEMMKAIIERIKKMRYVPNTLGEEVRARGWL